MRFSDTLPRKKRWQSESNRPLWDWSTDLLVMSHNQVGKRATCSFILFIDNSSHIYYAVRMANFNFLAQPIIITILFSLRFSRQNKHNTICNIIPFASLRTQKRWLNIRWFLGPQQWFYIKNSNRTTQSGVSPFPISLSLTFYPTRTRCWLFLLMDWRGRFRWSRHFLIREEFSQAWRYWRTYPSCEIDNHNFFEVVGGQSQGFVVRLWLLLSWNESKYLCVDSRNEILPSEEPFLLVSLSLSRDEIRAYAIVWW